MEAALWRTALMSWTLMSAPTEPVGVSRDENTWCFYPLGLPGRLDLLGHLFEDLSRLVVVADAVRLIHDVVRMVLRD